MPKVKTKTRKGEPFSIRLSLPTQRLIEHEARRLKRSRSAVVEELRSLFPFVELAGRHDG